MPGLEAARPPVSWTPHPARSGVSPRRFGGSAQQDKHRSNERCGISGTRTAGGFGDQEGTRLSRENRRCFSGEAHFSSGLTGRGRRNPRLRSTDTFSIFHGGCRNGRRRPERRAAGSKWIGHIVHARGGCPAHVAMRNALSQITARPAQARHMQASSPVLNRSVEN